MMGGFNECCGCLGLEMGVVCYACEFMLCPMERIQLVARSSTMHILRTSSLSTSRHIINQELPLSTELLS